MNYTWITEVQTQIYSKLTGDTTLMDAIEGVFDFVPDGQEYPFIKIGEFELNPFDTQNTHGWEAFITIDLWHRPDARGKAPVFEIQGMIYDLLQETDFTLTCANVLSMRLDNSNIVADPDNVTYHGIQRFRLLIGGE